LSSFKLQVSSYKKGAKAPFFVGWLKVKSRQYAENAAKAAKAANAIVAFSF